MRLFRRIFLYGVLMNHSKPHQHHRRSIRLCGCDYTQEGGYFITIMTQRGEHLFGTVVHGVVQLSEMGAIAHQCWLDIPKHFSRAVLDEFVVMPNHIHGIIFLTNDSSVTKPADAKATDGVTNGTTDGTAVVATRPPTPFRWRHRWFVQICRNPSHQYVKPHPRHHGLATELLRTYYLLGTGAQPHL